MRKLPVLTFEGWDEDETKKRLLIFSTLLLLDLFCFRHGLHHARTEYDLSPGTIPY